MSEKDPKPTTHKQASAELSSIVEQLNALQAKALVAVNATLAVWPSDKAIDPSQVRQACAFIGQGTAALEAFVVEAGK